MIQAASFWLSGCCQWGSLGFRKADDNSLRWLPIRGSDLVCQNPFSPAGLTGDRLARLQSIRSATPRPSKQHPVQRVRNVGLVPVAHPPPAGRPGPAADLLRRVLPGDPGPSTKKIPGERRAAPAALLDIFSRVALVAQTRLGDAVAVAGASVVAPGFTIARSPRKCETRGRPAAMLTRRVPLTTRSALSRPYR